MKTISDASSLRIKSQIVSKTNVSNKMKVSDFLLDLIVTIYLILMTNATDGCYTSSQNQTAQVLSGLLIQRFFGIQTHF